MIEVTHRHDVAVLTMTHGKANLFDLEFCQALTSTFAATERSSAKAAVVVGRGAIFSAGVDLVRLTSSGAAYADSFIPALGKAFETVFTFSKPLVAAVNGHAIAGGCILACAADRRLMARGTGRIGVPELLVGVAFPTIALEIVRQAVAPQHLRTLIYTAETAPPEKAIEYGLVDALVDADRLLDEAVAAAEAMAALPREAFALAKSQLRAPALARIREGELQFDPVAQKLWAAPETLDGVRRYVERTLKK